MCTHIHIAGIQGDKSYTIVGIVTASGAPVEGSFTSKQSKAPLSK